MALFLFFLNDRALICIYRRTICEGIPDAMQRCLQQNQNFFNTQTPERFFSDFRIYFYNLMNDT